VTNPENASPIGAASAAAAPPTAASLQPTAAGVRTVPSFLTASLRIFDLSLGRMLWSRGTIFMGLIVGLPVVLALIVRVGQMLFGDGGGFRVDGRMLPGPTIFGFMIWFLYLRFIVPILAVYYGTSLVADEVEDKTITYLFTRPIPRGAVMAGKYLAYLVCTVMVVLPSVMLVYFLVVPLGGGSVAATFMDLLKDMGLLALGLMAYGAVSAWVGARFKRPMVMGLAFVFGWEQAALIIPGYMRKFTVAYYLQSLVPQAMPSDGGVASLLQSFFRDYPSLPVALSALVGISAVFLYLAIRVIERREYVLEQ
jgi:ABC-type transport system involved in multi-copper enzyme maturation permease subunit